jgi:hypothetical protein
LSILVCLRLVYPMFKNGQSRETCNIGYTRRRQTRMDNPEKLVTLGTQDQEKQE